MGKVRVTIWPSKKGPDGKVPVYVVLRHKRERATVATPVSVKEKDWNDRACEVRKTARDFAEINKYLAVRRDEADSALLRAILRGDDHPCQAAKVELERGQTGGDFLAFCREQLEQYKGRRQWGTHEAYSAVVEKLEAYVRSAHSGRRELSFGEITVKFVEGFRTYLVEEHRNGPATVAKNLATVRTMLYAAIRHGLFDQAKNPFFSVRLPTPQPARKRPLSIEEIWRLEDTEFTRGRLNDARNVFVFAFYEGGVRASDVLQLTPADLFLDGETWRVGYTAEKTGKESYPFPLWPSAERILRSYGWPDLKPDRYIFPFVSPRVRRGSEAAFHEVKKKLALVNKYLAIVRERIGIEVPLTTHIARHTFSHYLDEQGWSIQQIQHLLRHSDSQVTERYLRSMQTGRYDERLGVGFLRKGFPIDGSTGPVAEKKPPRRM